MENKEQKSNKINGVMGWLSAVIIAFITALIYPVKYFWVKGIADYYKMDTIYLYGNYSNIIDDVLVTLASISIGLMIFYILAEWIMKKSENIYEIIGRWTIVVFILALINYVFLCVLFYKIICSEILLANLIFCIILTISECIFFIPCSLVLYRESHKTEVSKEKVGTKICFCIIALISCTFILAYNMSSKQIAYNKEYEIIQSEEPQKVIISKYQDMFYTYDCTINNSELTIHTNKSELIDMRDVKFSSQKFDKIIIE